MENHDQELRALRQSGRFRHVLTLVIAIVGLSGCDQAKNVAGKSLVAIDQATRDDDDDDLPPVPPRMSVMLFQGEQLTSDVNCAEIKITNEIKANRPPSDYFLGNFSEFGDFYNDERNTHQIRGSMKLEQIDESGETQTSEKMFDLGLDESGEPSGAAVVAGPYVATNGNFTFVIQQIEIDEMPTEYEGELFTSYHSWGTTGQVEINVEEKTRRRSYLPDDRIEFVCGYKYKAYFLFEKEIPLYSSDPLYAEMLDLQEHGVDLSAW